MFFLFNQSKNNVVLEARTGHFQGLFDFETKTKDLNFEAKAKDLKLCSRGRSRGQGHLLGLRLSKQNIQTHIDTVTDNAKKISVYVPEKKKNKRTVDI